MGFFDWLGKKPKGVLSEDVRAVIREEINQFCLEEGPIIARHVPKLQAVIEARLIETGHTSLLHPDVLGKVVEDNQRAIEEAKVAEDAGRVKTLLEQIERDVADGLFVHTEAKHGLLQEYHGLVTECTAHFPSVEKQLKEALLNCGWDSVTVGEHWCVKSDLVAWQYVVILARFTDPNVRRLDVR